MDAQGAELILSWYKDLEGRLCQFIKYIPYNDNNKDVVLPLLASVIVEAGSLIDTVFREEYDNPPKPKRELNIKNFASHYEGKFAISQKKTLLYVFPMIYLQPFSGWIDPATSKYSPLAWWDSHNKIKHNRVEQHSLSTLQTAIKSLCALHQTISQLPTFVEALVRHEMVCFGQWGRDYAMTELRSENPKTITVLIETELFGSPRGQLQFPNDINEISPLRFGMGNKLQRFPGREI